MAQRRMFSLKVIDTDLFLDMPASAQSLYFHLAMRADDDGFVSSPRKIMKVCNSSDDDYKLLMAKQFLIPFDSGICVIRHWRIHNYIQADRYQSTIYQKERKQITIENGHYEEQDTKCIHDVSKPDTQVRLGKVRLGKDSEEPPKSPVKTKSLHPVYQCPMNKTRYETLCGEWGKTVVDSYFKKIMDYCDANGKKYKDYAAAASQWIERDIERGKGPKREVMKETELPEGMLELAMRNYE